MTWADLRCDGGHLNGRLLPGGLIEVHCRQCRSVHPGAVRVVHRFSTATGELVETIVVREDAARLLVPTSEREPG